MEIRENEAENKRKRIHESRKARAKSMPKEELKEEAQITRTVDPNFKPLDDEINDYIHKHGVLTLFHPINKEKYTKEVAKIIFKRNSINKTEIGLCTNYYLNKPSYLKDIEKLINVIKNESLYPFKINIDLGFIF